MKNNPNRTAKTSTAGESFPAAVLTRLGRSTLHAIGKNPHEMPATQVRKDGVPLATALIAGGAGAVIALAPTAVKQVENVMDKQINVGEQQAKANIEASHSDAAKAIIQANPEKFASTPSEEQEFALSPIAGEGIDAVTDVVNEAGGDVNVPQAIINADGTETDLSQLTNEEYRTISAGLQVNDKLVYRLPAQVGEQAAQKIAQESQPTPNQ